MVKIKLLFFVFIITFGIFSYTVIYGAAWKFLQTNSQGEYFYDSENITRSKGNIVGVWLKNSLFEGVQRKRRYGRFKSNSRFMGNKLSR